MSNGKGGRLLPILASVLVLVALAVSLAIISLQVPKEQRFAESILSARLALDEGKSLFSRWNLLRASRFAVSAKQWRQILQISAHMIPLENQKEGDYRFFTAMARRAASKFSGYEDFPAYWIWGLVRSGKSKKAGENIYQLDGMKWSSLRGEIRLKNVMGEGYDDFTAFQSDRLFRSDPEFLAQAAILTESAELTFNTALLYMLMGNPKKAYDRALVVANGSRRWRNADLPHRRGIDGALAEIAYDAGYRDVAIEWLSRRIDDTQQRRVESWEQLQFLGDLLWERYLVGRAPEDQSGAANAWRRAIEILSQDSSDEELQGDSWRLWVNLAVLEEQAGEVRHARELLQEALELFPEVNEVKAAWARASMSQEPAMARRIIRNIDAGDTDPVMGITSMMVDPESISPRLYESRMWDLFEVVTQDASPVNVVESRLVTEFLLDYMAFRKNYEAMDVAIDRYRRSRPEESWILIWRLAADASRGIGIINLIPPVPQGIAPYDEYRSKVRNQRNWRGLHDSALFALLAAEELKRSAESFPVTGAFSSPEVSIPLLLAMVESSYDLFSMKDSPMRDRIANLIDARDDIGGYHDTLKATGRRGRGARSTVQATLLEMSGVLMRKALEDIDLAVELSANLSKEEQSLLLYIQSLVLYKMGRIEEALYGAGKAVDLNPENIRARDLLTKELNS